MLDVEVIVDPPPRRCPWSGRAVGCSPSWSTYVVSPAALGPAASSPAPSADRLSAGYVIALAARVVRELSDLARHAFAAEKCLATLAIDTEIRCRSAAERAELSQELTVSAAALAARYHDGSAPGGRPHRLIVLAHPLDQLSSPPTATESPS